MQPSRDCMRSDVRPSKCCFPTCRMMTSLAQIIFLQTAAKSQSKPFSLPFWNVMAQKLPVHLPGVSVKAVSALALRCCRESGGQARESTVVQVMMVRTVGVHEMGRQHVGVEAPYADAKMADNQAVVRVHVDTVRARRAPESWMATPVLETEPLA